MDKRALTALLSSLISNLLLLLPLPTTAVNHPSPTTTTTLLHHLLSISQTAATLSVHKRKRSPSPEPDPSSSKTRIPKTPNSFNLYFNMNSSTFEWLSSLLEPLLECRDPVNFPLNLPVETRLGIGIFRLATASDFSDIALRFNVSEPVARFCVNQFCRVLCTDFRFWVGFPTQNELGPVSESLETLTGLPNCCGVMHCTRFMVLKHASSNELEPVAAQIVADSSLRILGIVTGFSGKKSNEVVLKSSTLYNDVESGRLLNSEPLDVNGVSIRQYLIGDRGYPLLPWLMVPFDRRSVKLDSNEERFNSAHELMMVSGFRTVDSLKNWGVLSKPIKEEVKTMVGYIGACSILHNALLTREDYSCLSDKSDDYLRSSYHSEYDVDVSLKDDLIQQKGFEIRSALATRARRCL